MLAEIWGPGFAVELGSWLGPSLGGLSMVIPKEIVLGL